MQEGNLRIDIITPVYNNRQFIERCLASAHQLDEVNKIIVVDDGSTDGTLSLLNELKARYSKLMILTHPGNVNKGIACSRNLAIQNATSEWIAFLDSDDYYLPDRFAYFREILLREDAINGIYEPVINRVVSEQGAARFTNEHDLNDVVIGINPERNPEKAFESMYYGKGGGVVHLNGLTIKRTLAESAGLFDENLRIVDDSVFRLKVAYLGNFARGSLQPVAVRTIHDTNSEPNIKAYDVFMKHKVLLDFFMERGASKKLARIAIKREIFFFLKYKQAKSFFSRAWWIMSYALMNPRKVFAFI